MSSFLNNTFGGAVHAVSSLSHAASHAASHAVNAIGEQGGGLITTELQCGRYLVHVKQRLAEG
jgi:hypothetical protein